MAEVDTSSYPKPAAAAPVSLLDNVQKLGGLQQQQQQIQSGALTIDKQKLDLVNQRFGEMAKGFTGLIAKPDLSIDDITKYTNDQVKLGYVPPEMAAQTLSTLPLKQPGMSDAQYSGTLKDALKLHLQHAGTIVDAINIHAGQNQDIQDNSNIYSGVRKSPLNGGGFTPSTVTPIQLPPNQPNMNTNPQSPDYLRPGVIGPSAPAGPKPYVAAPPPITAPPGPVNDPSQGNLTGQPQPPATGLRGAVQQPDFNSRFGAAFPNSVATGPAPGQQSAMEAVGSQSGKDYASALTRGKNLQSDLYPMQRVMDIVHEEGPKAFGPGTEGLNSLKSALVTWLPNVDQKIIDGVSNFEQAKKYLVQAARTAGNTGTNDQLAAAFEANPNVKMSGATIENVIKSNIALRKMDHAQTLMFGKTGLPDDQYSKWVAGNQNILDARAFGFDMMDTKAKTKLVDQLKKDPKAYKRFEDSLHFANDAQLIEPPASK